MCDNKPIDCNNLTVYDCSKLPMCRGRCRIHCIDKTASQYQNQRIINNTVRVQSSLYTMNLAALTAYQYNTRVNWNQMSDQPYPSFKSNNGSRRGKLLPGSSPGGIGVDVKHNSYDRYLNRLKGKGPLKQGFKNNSGNYGGNGIINSCYCSTYYLAEQI